MSENEKAARRKKVSNVAMWVILLVVFLAFIAPFSLL